MVLWPEAGATTEEIHHHVGRNVVIKSGSVVIVKTRNWYLENVTVQGTLILEDENSTAEEQGMIKLCNCQISNEGWKYIPTYRALIGLQTSCQLICRNGREQNGNTWIDPIKYGAFYRFSP